MTILLVEDLPPVQKWLRSVIEQAFPGATIKLAASVQEALQCLQQNQFELALLDIGLPDGSGLQIVEKIHANNQQADQPCTIIMSTIFDDDEHLFSALRKGAEGYLLKDQSQQELIEILQKHQQGQAAISPAIAHKLLRFFQPGKEASPLTTRENEMLILIAKGITVPVASDQLSIKPSTGYEYVRNIYRKLNINSRSEATLYATRTGLIDPKST